MPGPATPGAFLSDHWRPLALVSRTHVEAAARSPSRDPGRLTLASRSIWGHALPAAELPPAPGGTPTWACLLSHSEVMSQRWGACRPGSPARDRGREEAMT